MSNMNKVILVQVRHTTLHAFLMSHFVLNEQWHLQQAVSDFI